jgi:hypothetical protein
VGNNYYIKTDDVKYTSPVIETITLDALEECEALAGFVRCYYIF